MEELSDLDEFGLLEAARGHRGRADAHASRRHGRHVPVDSILVERDVELLKDLFHFRARESEGAEVPEHQVVLGAVRRELVPLAHEEGRERRGVRLHLLGVQLELGRGNLLELRGEAGDLVVVRAALQRREDGLVRVERFGWRPIE